MSLNLFFLQLCMPCVMCKYSNRLDSMELKCFFLWKRIDSKKINVIVKNKLWKSALEFVETNLTWGPTHKQNVAHNVMSTQVELVSSCFAVVHGCIQRVVPVHPRLAQVLWKKVSTSNGWNQLCTSCISRTITGWQSIMDLGTEGLAKSNCIACMQTKFVKQKVLLSVVPKTRCLFLLTQWFIVGLWP